MAEPAGFMTTNGTTTVARAPLTYAASVGNGGAIVHPAIAITLPGGTVICRKKTGSGDDWIYYAGAPYLVREGEVWFLPTVEAGARGDFVAYP